MGGPELNDDRNAFLRQFVVHIAYEARLIGADRLCFFYSYPSSYDESTYELIRTFWRSELASLSSIVGVPCELSGSQTESVASAFYFSRKFRGSAIFENAATVLDIGGHTSDISVWRQGRLEIQASVPFSGREILVCPLEENRQYTLEILAICIENGPAIIKPLGLLSGGPFMNRAEAILRAHGKKFLYRMSVLYGTQGFGQFRSQVALRLATLAYYAGLLLRRRKWAESGIPLPDIYIGGNGSRSLHWLAPPYMQPDHPMMGLLSLAYRRGAGFDGAPSENRIFLSNEPKWEVAYGLLYSENNSLAGQDQFIEVVSGESFESEGETYLETEPLTTALLKAGVRINRAQELQSLLSLYNEFAETRRIALLPVRNNAEVVERAQSAINEWARRKVRDNPRKMRVEPAFIIGASNALPIVEW